MAAADLPIGNEGSLTGDTAKEVVAAPGANKQRIIPVNGLRVYNADTVAHTITASIKKAAATYPVWKTVNLAAGEIDKMDAPVTLDATDESLEVIVDADNTTTEPTFSVSAVECS